MVFKLSMMVGFHGISAHVRFDDRKQVGLLNYLVLNYFDN